MFMLMSPVLTSSMALTYLQPQQALLHYPTQQLQVAPVPQQPGIYHPPQAIAPPPPPPPHQVQPLPSPPEPLPVIPQQSEPLPTATQPTSTTTVPRLFDVPSIAYPGDFCQLPQTVCVGGSVCVNVPLVTDTTTTTSHTIVEASTVSTTPLATTTTTQPTTTTSTTPTTTTTTQTASIATEAATTTRAASTMADVTTTTVPSTTTTAYIGRIDQIPQANPYRCVSCCQPNARNCQPQVIRIDLSYPIPSRGCLSSIDCQRGSFCRQGVCRR
ncbi:hypothetical protein Y032_0138g2048 [Ancylostoma ceylanicum]|uniref:Uncharacterized protein n=4 Tax=Ancylostoma ceylanicum TaxID=53326 RepID=A0A016T4Q8_9BILA|nr:hypothetical protein Y032_0138g2048 [Ancylostoma ceylanicum]